MQKKTVAMIAVMGFAAAMLTGCGIPKEEHAAVVADLEAKMIEIKTLNGEKADLQSDLEAEQQKVRTSRIELEDASGQITNLKAEKEELEGAVASEKSTVSSLESSLSASKSRYASAQTEIGELENNVATLQEANKVLTARWEQIELNREIRDDVMGKTPSAPKAGDDKSASDMLDDMLSL